ncbi:apoptosis facilitator Bcl-2-like protein 14 [Leptodactylus fuscus]|uniref:apoptosis facilitator Bcl-2-like protein 14 n=1 Tax=Leptodactylus fuscus TaxID=238119 RepID=UPI003F4F2AE1
MERKQRGKFVSLTKQEAKIVLETYIKRSLSSREVKRTGSKKNKRVQRSVSDVTRFTSREKSKITVVPPAAVQGTEKKDRCETCVSPPEPIAKAKTVKKQSWFKSFLNHLFKKDDNSSEQIVSVVNKVAQDSVASSTEGHSDQTTKKNSFRKASIRKVLSFKKNNADERLKRPNNLPLKRIYKPCPVQPRKCDKNEGCYYEQVSAEIENLVKDTENLDIGGRTQSFSGDLNTHDLEFTIKKIVTILQMEGDAYDRKIKEDPSLNNFFRDFSYNSFKQLADVYVDQGVKKKDSDTTSEDMKFAFSIHFTKQVVGLSTHPVNRIMGFGDKYLQDTFTWLSYSRENLAVDLDPEACISPD